jgi:glycosyltransferase involved in cell wall biosynthesis
MRVLYLFTSYRGEALEKAKRGDDHGNGFWGMLRLHAFGIDADYLEPEHFYSRKISLLIRKHMGVYWLHLSFFLSFFSYDFVFTSTAFGTQLIHTLLHIKRPKWVMHDFSIMGLIGREQTLRQKVFAYMVKRCAGIVTLGRDEKERLEERFPNLRGRVECIPYGVDLEFFSPDSRIARGKFIYSQGRDPDRDYATLFEAAKDFSVPVVVTTYASRLKKFDPLPSFVQVKDYSIQEYVDAYRRALFVVLPLDISSGLNNAMGFSVLQESLAMGKAIIATRTGTTETYITDGENGLLVPGKDPQALGAAIERLLSDNALRERLERNARAYAEAHLGADMLTERLANFFRKLEKTS